MVVSGKTITLNVYKETQIGELKQMIKDKEDIPEEYQRLVFASKPLDDIAF